MILRFKLALSGTFGEVVNDFSNKIPLSSGIMKYYFKYDLSANPYQYYPQKTKNTKAMIYNEIK